MDDKTVTPAETIDQPDRDDERAAFVTGLHTFADFLAANPWVPLPSRTYASKQLNYMNSARESVASTMAELREIAGLLGVTPDENLADRTRVFTTIGSVEYGVLVWHPAGRPGELDEREAELERLRAEVAELRAAQTSTKHLKGCLGAFGRPCTCDTSGLTYTRADSDEDDPTPVSPARGPLRTGSVGDDGLVVDGSES